MFFWNSLRFSMLQRMLAIWSLIPLPFLKIQLEHLQVHAWFMYCWSLAWRILSITLLVYEMSAIVQKFEHSLALPFFGTGVKTDLFQSCGHCWVFQTCWHTECSTLIASSTNNWIKDLLSMVPPIRTRLSFPSVSLSHQEASINLLSLSIRA